MMMPDAVPRSRAVCTSMRTTDGPMACATLANARDSARASLGASVAAVTRVACPPATDCCAPASASVTPTTSIPANVRIARPPSDNLSRDGRSHSERTDCPDGRANARVSEPRCYAACPVRRRARGAALLDRDEARAAGTAHAQQMAVLLRRAQRCDRLLGRTDRAAINLDHDVARLQAGALGRASGDHVRDDGALRAALEPQRARDVRGQRLQAEANLALAL